MAAKVAEMPSVLVAYGVGFLGLAAARAHRLVHDCFGVHHQLPSDIA